MLCFCEMKFENTYMFSNFIVKGSNQGSNFAFVFSKGEIIKISYMQLQKFWFACWLQNYQIKGLVNPSSFTNNQ